MKKKTDDDTDENCVILKDFVVHCLKQKLYEFHDIASNILAAILPIASQILLTCRNGLKFNSVLPIIMILSEVCENDKIIKTICQEWIKISKKYLLSPPKSADESATSLDSQSSDLLESTNNYLSFFADILKTILNDHPRYKALGGRPASPLERDISTDFDCDYLFDDVNADDGSGQDDSEEDSLSNKLCTYTMTQKVSF